MFKELLEQYSNSTDTVTNTDKTTETSETSNEFIYWRNNNAELLQKLTVRGTQLEDTIAYDDSDTAWTHGASYFGIDTFYRMTEGDSSIIVKMQGHLQDFPLFETVAVIHEVDLFTKWIPFCCEAKNCYKRGKAELYPYVVVL